MLAETFYVEGHSNIIATHKTTIEFTKDRELTKAGDCIIGIKASKSMLNFSDEFKNALKNNKTKVIIEIECDGKKEKIKAYGNSRLILEDEKDMVIRKSDFICKRTLCIKADKAACNLSRGLVKKLINKEKARIKLTLIKDGE